MSDEAAFLEALTANPADDTARLVYADWLDEHDQPQKAEYLRAVAALADQPDLSANDLAARTAALGVALPRDWRLATAARFGLVYEGHDRDKKISAIKFVREITGSGLADAKKFVEAAPQGLLFRTTLEGALGVCRHSRGFQFRARAGGTGAPATFLGFDVYAERYAGFDEPDDDTGAESVEAFAAFLSAALGWDAVRAGTTALQEYVVLGSGLEYPALEDQLKRWTGLLPPPDPNRDWEIFVYARCVPNPSPSF